VTMLAAAAEAALKGHRADVRRLHEADLARGLGRLVLPFALDRKYPNASTEWQWQFVFLCGTDLSRSALRNAVAVPCARVGGSEGGGASGAAGWSHQAPQSARDAP
jgi:hypothetical protein